ncbi:MAG: hypothetical protein XD36_2450 [Halomonas sp. 54_146]|nr:MULTISPECIES: hypothetical protein [unclassified Halomonas]KUJ87089.1 MAG: hypothetical protein XD36_2450 [Halomonas sp. 54_146]HAA45199.1 hypothetical protein [Halomonas sp.]
MSKSVQTISAYNVINDVIPKLNVMETLVEGTLKEIIENSYVPAQVERYSKLQIEFQLELTMIRMNLEHLLKRYQHELTAVVDDKNSDMLLTLDAHEATAIESATALYRRVQQLQQAR